MPGGLITRSLPSTAFILLLPLLFAFVEGFPLGSTAEVEGSAEEPTLSPEQIQWEYEEYCRHRGPFCLDQQYVNIGITILGGLVFLISACIAGCVSRRQGNV